MESEVQREIEAAEEINDIAKPYGFADEGKATGEQGDLTEYGEVVKTPETSVEEPSGQEEEPKSVEERLMSHLTNAKYEPLTDADAEAYKTAYLQMLAQDKIYCATAYLYALATRYERFEPIYRQLAYAVNDPKESCEYSSDRVFSVYFGFEEQNEGWTLSATLRNFFINRSAYDFLMRDLYGAISGFRILEEIPTLRQVVYELQVLKAPYWYSNDEVARIQQLNQDFMEQKDIGEMFTACFRKPNEGEVPKTMNCSQIIEIIQKDYPSLQNTIGNKVRLGKIVSALGFNFKDHSHVPYYEVIPLRVA